jgi:DNA (cytosine-5)-methyltransferase 1
MKAPARRHGVTVDLFAGCGGASIGFHEAGLPPVAAVEIDEQAATAYGANLGVAPLVKDIRRVNGDELLKSAGLQSGECTLLSGCPPCQSFTILRRGSEATPLDRLRNSLYLDYLRIAEALRPRHIAFENVPGMLGPRWRPRFDALLDGLADLGYDYLWDVVDAADFGVPQRRRRVLVIASRVTRPMLPRPTHAEQPTGRLRPYVTVRETIGSLPPLVSGEVDPRDPYHRARRHSSLALRRLRAIPEGGARMDLPSDLQLDCHRNHDGHYDIYGRMWWDRPSPTLTSGCTNVTRGRFAHPDQDRALTLREAMLLQTLPRGTVLSGGVEEMALQVGNAIPPLLARRVGEAIVAMEMRSHEQHSHVTAAATSITGVPSRSRAERTLASSAT